MKQAPSRNDGYVLPYVLMVFLVLSFMALSVCGISLNHFRAQQAFVRQTQSRYEAEGRVEQAVAWLEVLKSSSEPACLTIRDAVETAAMDFWSKADALDEAALSVELDEDAELTNTENHLTVTAASDDGSVRVTARLHVCLVIVPEDFDGGFEACGDLETLEYAAYDISHPVVEGGDTP